MALVTYVTGNCPGCGGEGSFGNVMVSGNQILLGCKQCRYTALKYLPPIQKKVVYLDQCVLSGAFRGEDPRFVEVVEGVERLCSMQLMVAPYSSVHEDETHQWRGHGGRSFDQLMDFIKQTSRGSEFDRAYEVERTQTVKGFKAYLAQQAPDYTLDESDAIRGDLHDWDNYFYIDVGRYMGDVEEMRQRKAQAVTTLVGLFDDWASSTTTFEQDFALELNAVGEGYLNAYFQMVQQVGRGEPMAYLNAPIMAMMVNTLKHCMPRDTDPMHALQTIRNYFASQHFAQLPCEYLSCSMFATMKAMVKRGAYANRETAVQRLSGVFYDVKHISTYAPYCDAFFMDQPMADLVCSPTVRLDQKFKTKVFSLNSIDRFREWLNEVEAEMTDEHRQGLSDAYFR